MGALGLPALLLAAFLLNEKVTGSPLLPLSIFRTRGLLAANVTGFLGFSGLLAMFYFLTLGLGPVFVGVTSAANSGIPADKAGVAAAIMNSFQQTGGELGLAIMSAVATSQSAHLIARGIGLAPAATSGYQHALLTGCWLTAGAALFALRTANTRAASMPGEQAAPADEDLPGIGLTAVSTTD